MTKGAVRILSAGVTERQGVCRDGTEHSRLQAEALRTMPAGGRKLDLRIAAPGRQWRLAKGAGSWALLSPPVIAMVMDDIVPANSGEVVLLRASYQRALQLEGESPPAMGFGASLETQAKVPAEPKRSGPGAQLTEIVKTPQALATQVQGLSRGRFPALSATSRRSRCNTVSNSGRAVYGTQGSGKPVGPALEVLPAQDPGEGL